ncbi:hypothetical protein P3X46_028749 [Hevea brasiliensis]|uniref:Glycosyltransferase 61 catalytic domain-containing protein n=1 Tax=Hevea brasiliensis TaxID=3981 RepID=A0ABQ9KSZ9_HEVBR|nr:uncharacterized protein LOC131168703 [Hevea brasiliensis]KAJ9146490.1 hypothetical protein P3X46_028749 [Hevea brasiliensis]
MELERSTKAFTKKKSSHHLTKIITSILLLLLILILIQSQASPFNTPSTSASWAFFNKWKGLAFNTTDGLAFAENSNSLISKLQDSVTFFPLKDLRFAKNAMEGNTWFMSSLNDTRGANEAEYLYFPSEMSKGRLLCIKGNDMKEGTRNSYALAWPEALPDTAKLMEGLTFVSDTYYDYVNLWHGLCAMAPFVSWSINNNCPRPTRWVLFHWGELRSKMGSWLQHLMEANFGAVKIEGLEEGDRIYCFEKAVVMRHNEGSMGKEKKLQVSDLLRCKARRFCGIYPSGKGKEVNERGEPIIKLTLLMRRGSRSFKNATAVIDIFARECAKVEGCTLRVAESEDLNFCDQVRVMTHTDIVASPHGAQLTNMLFMDRNSSVMEFFPKGWLELAGIGQYAHHWMADQSGMNHQGSWWEPLGKKECPSPQQDLECFNFYKDGKVGHNETHFAEWARIVLNQVKARKMEDAIKSYIDKPLPHSTACAC